MSDLAAVESKPAPHNAEEAIEGLPSGFGSGMAGRIAFWIAFTFSLFQLWTAAYGTLPSQVVRAMHVGFLLLLGFVLFGNLVAKTKAGKAWFWSLGILGFLTGIYNWIFYEQLILRSGFHTPLDLTVATVMILLVFEGARRLMGLPLTIIAAIFLAYCFFGQYFPPPFIHRGYDFELIVEHFGFGTEGIYGTPIYVSAAYIFIFVVFAAFLERAGMLALFNDFALGLVGTWRGGPAQVCVMSSALMGTISGSGVANVVASGQFTIPLMKRFGFRSSFAGGVEATSSMGGQIMPPVMGAVAFIMAETLNVPYADIVKAALIPAILYFGVCFWTVFLEAGKAGLRGMDRAELPNPWQAVREHWPLVLPLAVLVYLLFAGYTPIFAGTMGLALVVVLILGMPLAASIGPFVFRLVFWLAVGLAAASFLKFGVNFLALVILALIAACFFVKGGRETLGICRDAMAEGAKNALPVGIACAIVGIVIGTLTLTGIASTFIGFIIRVGEDNLFLSLVLTMITCLILGMGIPTIPNYIITSSLAGPALLELGVPLLVSHMFVFYFGIMADLTPPVALACFAAAPMAKTSGLKISIQATKLAAAGFIVPFMAVYTPALMLQDAGPIAAAWGYPVEVAYIFVKACFGIALWGVAVVGFLFAPLAMWERVLAFAAGASVVLALPWTDELGWALGIIMVGQHWLRARRSSRPVAVP
ncbi:putative transporter TrapT family, fused dctQ-M subunits, C4-dicarboxylate transport [Pseudorhizobium banfieldiae]|uniref:Putative transporter TrapT family, fused dctQ-M subunits, C4-dicarboxylate transport n=1 Tax=Pseudorhizobium banfieldiae TaxID=1125847 RepID=L0NB01_9HYPH|nr:TRAP transporter permease [Pseudorhizobium banfieldiae]CAD6601507.1 C4-dicarboxylate ABC transporter [arsenite-oxidising bacterium NT-25]CCF18210.1 putative transporter TrapT family, fused dctQ-M subunits, C4-dicarboxylate transport [Pseudorhizobium banfieldiae]